MGELAGRVWHWDERSESNWRWILYLDPSRDNPYLTAEGKIQIKFEVWIIPSAESSAESSAEKRSCLQKSPILSCLSRVSSIILNQSLKFLWLGRASIEKKARGGVGLECCNTSDKRISQ